MSINLSNNEHAYPFIIGNVKIPFFYQPYYNPNKITFSSKKAYNRTQTIGGNVFEAWGKDPVELKIEMTVLKQESLGGVIGQYKSLGMEDPLICTELLILQRMFEFDQRKLKDLSTNVLETRQAAQNAVDQSNGIFGNLGGYSNAFVSGLGAVSSEAGLLASKATTALTSSVLNNYADTIIYYKTNIYSGFFTNMSVEDEGKEPFINRVSLNFMVTSSVADTLNNWLATSTTGRSIMGVLGAASAVSTATAIIDSVSNGLTSTIKNISGKL